MKKVEEINKILSDDKEFEEYLNKLEKQNIEIPQNLNNKIFLKIKNNNKKYYTNICKMVACLIFCLAICRTSFIQEGNLKKQEVEENQTISQVQQKVSEICSFLTTPINKERKDL